MNGLDYTDSLMKLGTLSSSTLNELSKIGIKTLGQLIEHLPFRLEDHRRVLTIGQLPFDEDCVIKVEVLRVGVRTSRRGTLMIVAQVFDQSGAITAIWFNQRYLLSVLKRGREYLLYGTRKLSPKLNNPFYVKKILNKTSIEPIYPSTVRLKQSILRRAIAKSLQALPKTAIPAILPNDLIKQYNLPAKSDLLINLHQEPSPALLQKTKEFLALEELLILCLKMQLAKKKRKTLKSTQIIIDKEKLKNFVASLPFKLTEGQKRAAWEIVQDLNKETPMNRLMYGEVGSGKTAVALTAAFTAINSNLRVIWLNPTTTLAAQQHQTALDLIRLDKKDIALITSNIKQSTDAKMIIGTHALLNEKLNLNRIGLIIIDEQHRFGVEQRQKLIDDHPSSHLLMMTATPIPRSLAHIIFNHLDLTFLEGKPIHQKPVTTTIFRSKDRSQIETEIEEKLSRGESGYVIVPLIEDPVEVVDISINEKKTIAGEEQYLKERFKKYPLAIIHGKMNHEQKERALAEFRLGKKPILLATSVVEVGIDNPKATWLLVENADYFGLSSLHQMRGRIGRGEKASHCYLSDSRSNALGSKRLSILKDTSDGLTIAQKDLELRGPGELTGLQQSGLPPLKYANLGNEQMLKAAYQSAEKILSEGLSKYPHLLKILKSHEQNEEQTLPT